MPGTNLTRDEARTRARLLDVDSYTVELDLTTGETHFGSTTTLRFRCSEPGAETFADLVGAESPEMTLNGRRLDPTAYADGRIALTDLAADNELVVAASLPYSRTGEGLHRFVDPVDDRVYTYSQFEVPDARRVFTTFEQPDLKSRFGFAVTAPDSWTVVSNSPTPEPEPAGDGVAVWRFAETLPMSTYITAIIAGEYHATHDVYRGRFEEIPLGHYCRQSLVPYLDVDKLVEVTRQGFAYFEDAFDMAYPFGKYDQLYVPEYNMGAMENAGAVTLRDEYLPRGRQDASFYEFRATVILHEMAHMWFGDLVTMTWWDDLWLNESFAEWACHQAAVEATEFDEAWTGFANVRKNWALRQDQLPSTHPIAADNHDLRAVEVNFDGITYAKGASVLKQLVAWVGLDNFLVGLRDYFRDHAFGNTEFGDLLRALEGPSGRELDSWAKEWLQTSGVNTLTPRFDLDAEGRYTSFAVIQSASVEHPTLRRHRLGIGLYDAVPDGEGGEHLVRRTAVEVDVHGESTSIPDLVGERQPDLLLLNDGDLTYAKIRLDERSLATVVAGLSRLDDSLSRALCWTAAWDMTRDAEMRARDFVELVLGNIAAETDPTGSSRIPAYAAQAVAHLSDPAYRPQLRARWEQGLRALLEQAEAGSDQQLTFLRALAGAAHSEAALDLLASLLEGTGSLPGLTIDADIRWTLLSALAREGRVDADRIEQEAAADQTISGQQRAASARAARPTAEAKAEAWEMAVVRDDVPNETQRSTVMAFMQPGQEEVLAPYVERYLEAAATLWEEKGTQRASTALEGLFPRPLASAALLERVTQWLRETDADPAAQRYVREGAADVERYLAAQACDAS
ncbi:aminopeptidase N [Nocardioides aequoreus]|uniref:aminopeptidase N n=1 Tax=Nocardioides aequoreus TaxID=397278 RepID=UPI0004C34D4F|nr:aminopeptidase N [Nocardioides aequoreus]